MLTELSRRELVNVSDESSDERSLNCTACVEDKMSRPHFGEIKKQKSTAKLYLVHSDLCGPISVSSFGGAR